MSSNPPSTTTCKSFLAIAIVPKKDPNGCYKTEIRATYLGALIGELTRENGDL